MQDRCLCCVNYSSPKRKKIHSRLTVQFVRIIPGAAVRNSIAAQLIDDAVFICRAQKVVRGLALAGVWVLQCSLAKVLHLCPNHFETLYEKG